MSAEAQKRGHARKRGHSSSILEKMNDSLLLFLTSFFSYGSGAPRDGQAARMHPVRPVVFNIAFGEDGRVIGKSVDY